MSAAGVYDELDALDDIAISKPNGSVYSNGKPINGAPLNEQELLEAIISGANYHRASLSLLGHWASTGIGVIEAREQLVVAFECVFPADRDERWRTRVTEIDKLLAYVYGKEADKLDEQAEFTIGGSRRRPENDGISAEKPDESVSATAPKEVSPEEKSANPSIDEWPDPLGLAAYHGLAGEVVMAIEPHTEADTAAILFQFLTAAGNALGRRGYYLVEDTRHHPNHFCRACRENGEGTQRHLLGTGVSHVRRFGLGIALHHPRPVDRRRAHSPGPRPSH
jgi:hypothetical protein